MEVSMKKTNIALAACVIAAASLSNPAHARDVTDSERKWAADLRACAEAEGIPKSSIEFRFVGAKEDQLKVFYRSSVPTSVREKCEAEAKGKDAPKGKKTDL